MNWLEIVFLTLSSLALFYWLIRLRLKEKSYLQKSTKEAIAPELRKKFEEESAENKRKKEKFENILKDFGAGE